MDFNKKRLEKDLLELKKMIASHFVQREKDEQELTNLETRMSTRQEMRKKQVEERQQVRYISFTVQDHLEKNLILT